MERQSRGGLPEASAKMLNSNVSKATARLNDLTSGVPVDTRKGLEKRQLCALQAGRFAGELIRWPEEGANLLAPAAGALNLGP